MRMRQAFGRNPPLPLLESSKERKREKLTRRVESSGVSRLPAVWTLRALTAPPHAWGR